MTSLTLNDADVSYEEQVAGLHKALLALQTTIKEKVTKLEDKQVQQDFRDFLREVEQLVKSGAVTRRSAPNTAEIIQQLNAIGVHNSLVLVAQKAFGQEENALIDATVVKENSAGREVFNLTAATDSIVLKRSRVDRDAIEGGTWTRKWGLPN